MAYSSYDDISLTHHGLIEASAGTGKTYSLVHLALRYLTEGDTPLSIKQLVLVTYTNAAAAELKSRLRHLIKDKINLLNQSPLQNSVMLGRLKSAYNQFDEATIGTIHSFCQKIINSYTFENGGLIVSELGPDTSWKEELIRDFFRKNEALFNPLMVISYLSFAQFKDYDMALIAKELVSFIDENYNLELSEPSVHYQNSLIAMIEEFDGQAGFLYESYIKFLSVSQTTAWGDLFSKIKKGSTKLTSFLKEAECATLFKADIKCFDFLTLLDQTKDGYEDIFTDLAKFSKYRDSSAPLSTEEQFALEQIATMYDNSLPLMQDDEYKNRPYQAALGLYFVRAVLPSIKVLIDKKQQSNGLFSFNDIIFKVKELIMQPNSRLLAALRQSYRVALIDEFQDTDDTQWAIFSTIFTGPNHQLVLIGDPKQAIYSFRGANINSYHYATATIPSHNQCNLTTSYRSRPFLVKGVNYWFNQLYRHDSSIKYSTLNYLDQGTKVSLNNIEPSVCFIDVGIATEQEPYKKKVSLAPLKASILEQFSKKIAMLLQDDSALVSDGEGISRPLKASDIAFLCRKNDEAKAMKQALNRLNVPSVLYKSQSVFQSEEAKWLLLLLEVLATEHNEALAKTLLISPLFGNNLSLAQQSDLSDYFNQLNYYRLLANQNQWPKLFQELVRYSGFFEAILTGNNDDRERQYVNTNHLFDVISQLSRPEASSAHHLFKGFKRLVDRSTIEEENIRLERDDEAVHLLTIHGAKGLEYPVVFLFDGFYSFPNDRRKFYSIKKSQLRFLDFCKLKSHETQIKQAYYHEEKNLFYVGATRAQSLLYLPLTLVGETFYSDFLVDLINDDALRLGLNPGEAYHAVTQANYKKEQKEQGFKSDDTEWNNYGLRLYEGIKRFINSHGNEGFSIDCSLQQPLAIESLPADKAPLLTLKTMKTGRDFYQEIEKTSSYSALWQQDQPSDHGHDDIIKLAESPNTDFAIDDSPPLLSALTIQGGSDFGQLIHNLFETIDFELATLSFNQFKINDLVTRLVADASAKYFNHQWAKKHCTVVTSILWESLNQPIKALGDLKLATLTKECRKHELEFLIPLKKSNNISLGNFNGYLKNGYLKGFIDLVFVHQGLYYILDWKTTNLGSSIENYSQPSMAKAMEQHGYQLQYYLYLYALEIYGKSLDASFNYTDHIGGVVYCFNRAASALNSDDTAFFIDKPPRAAFLNFINQLS